MSSDLQRLQALHGHLNPNPVFGMQETSSQKKSSEKSVFYPFTVTVVQDITPRFRLVEIQGDRLREVIWNPGEKMKVRVGNSHRSYTPMFVDRESGKTQFLIHIHGNGQGANWARDLQIGEEAHLTDPKPSLKLPPKESEIIFFGDETTFGAACAVRSFCRNSRQLFEVASLEEGGKVLLHRNFSTAQLTLKEEGNAHLEKVAKQIIEMAASCRDPQVVLMGKKQSILKVTELLRSQNFPSENCRSKDHWSHKLI